jgi:hypothetical protein
MKRLLPFAILLLALPAHAQERYRFELSLSPGWGSLGQPFAANGFEVSAPQNGPNITAYGLGVEFGVLASPVVEPGLGLNVVRVEVNGTGSTQVALTPNVKLNYWLGSHLILYGQPFAGLVITDATGSTSQSYFDGGVFFGLEALIHSWGIRVYTGLEYIRGDFGPGVDYVVNFPIRWALVGYF